MKKFKKYTLIFALIFSQSANATLPGAYVGLGLGTVYLPAQSDVGLTLPILAGYNFDRHFGIEGSFFKTFTSTSNVLFPFFGDISKYDIKAFNVVGKGYLSFREDKKVSLDTYLLGGLSFLRSECTSHPWGEPSETTVSKGIRPVYGVGVGLNFYSRVSTFLEFKQIYSNGAIPKINLLTLNLAYHF